MIVSESRTLRLLLKDCANGFYQQMYFLGKDVLHSKGNQLQEYGFRKSPSKGLKGTSCYTYESESGVIELYGSCAAFYSNASNVVFLRKRCRFYQWLPDEKLIAGCWRQEDLTLASPEVMLAELTPLLSWWVNYEKWVLQRLGEHYREQCFSDWKKVKGKKGWLTPLKAMAWVQLLIDEKEGHLRPKHFQL